MSRVEPIGAQDLFAWVGVSAPLVSEDGRFAAYRRTAFDEQLDRRRSRLVVRGLAPDAVEEIVLEDAGEFCWAPTGSRLHYARHRDGRDWLVTIDASRSGESCAEVPLDATPLQLASSPDGMRVALVGEHPLPPVTLGVDLAGTAEQQRPVVSRHLVIRGDRGEQLGPMRVVIAFVDLDAGTVEEAELPPGASAEPTEDGVLVDLDWLPSGAGIVASLATGRDPQYDLPSRHRAIYRYDISTSEWGRLTHGRASARSPRVSPDGSLLAMLQQRGDDSSFYPFFHDLHVLDLRSGEGVTLTESLDVDVTAAGWLGSTELCFSHPERGRIRLGRISLDGALDILSEEALSQCQVNRRGDVGVIRRSATCPDAPAVISVRAGSADVRDVETPNAWLSDRERALVTDIDYPSAHPDRLSIHAVVAYPPGADPRQLPVIVDLHGGPYAASGTPFSLEREILVAAGYVVVQPNYRGSAGFGERMARLGDWSRYPGRFDDPHSPHEMGLDVVGVLDAIREQGLGDPDRVFLRGFSAGALLTTWTIGRTDRFRAAVAESWYSGEWSGASYGWFQLRYYFEGPPWEAEHVEEYWRRHPLMLVPQVRTPLLLTHGERDWVTPILEVEKYYYALRTRGAEVVFAVFPEEGHGISDHPASQHDELLMELGWFEEHDQPNH